MRFLQRKTGGIRLLTETWHRRGIAVACALALGALATAQNVALPEGRARDTILPVGDTSQVIRPLAAAGPDVRALAESSPFADNWDPEEYQSLSASEYDTTDVLAALPPGTVSVPGKPLSLEELLAANRPEEPISYASSPLAPYAPSRSSDPFKSVGGGGGTRIGELPTGQIQIECPDFLDYDDERHMIYGHGRVTARYGIYKLQADRMMIDTRLREIQAYGNVILTSDQDYIEAESMWVDAAHSQGVAYNTRGRTGPFFFLADPMEGDGRTTFRQLNRQEAYLKDASFTTCDFPVPHFRLHAREFTIMYNDRIFGRNVVLYVWETPVLWLPYFTRALRDPNPWGATLGTDNRLGFFLRVWYDFYHACYVPSDIDENIMVKNTRGRARLMADFFSDRGFGKGLNYSYYFDQGRHRGDLFAYHINDKERDIVGEESSERFYVDWFHRTKITDQLQWLVDVDYPSDPDIFYDIFDRVRSTGDVKRDRLPERRLLTGLEWTAEDFFAGLQIELKDRIGRDRVSNFADPRDGDYDFDRGYNDEQFTYVPAPADPFDMPGVYTDPTSVDDDNLDNGVSTRRYGRVSERLPQLTVSSNRMRLWCLPLWYHVDLNVFNNLDKGLNVVGTEDDAYVHGFDLYQSISHLAKFCERYTLLTKVGLGVAAADREEDSFGYDFPDGATFPFRYHGQLVDGQPEGMIWTDEDTFLVGKRKMSLSQVDPLFAYGDIDSRFNARISDCLTAWVRYRFREVAGNSLGEFYEAVGARKTQDDLYAFRNPEHWLETGLTYNLVYPRLNATLSAGKNLQGEDDIHPHELLHYVNLGGSWANLANTVLLNAGVSLQERQQRDTTDPYEFQQNSLVYYLAGNITPVHRRYYARFSTTFIQNQDDDPYYNVDDDDAFDTRNETISNVTLGKKIGTKYLVELSTRIRSSDNGSQDSWLSIQRDFHDLVAGVMVGVESDELDDDDEDSEEEDGMQVRLNFRFKPAHEKGVLPTVRAADLYSAGKLGAFETAQ